MKLTYTQAKQQGLLIAENKTDYVLIYHTAHIKLEDLMPLRFNFRKPLRLSQVSAEVFSDLLKKHYLHDMNQDIALPDLSIALPEANELLDSDTEAPVIRLLNSLCARAIEQKASDIHFETFVDKLSVRFRIDGLLVPILDIQRELAAMIIARIKIMANLDIAEKRTPQDGHIALTIAEHQIDVRVSTMPANYGERAVLRLLDKNNALLNLAQLGMQPLHLEKVNNLLARSHGIILVTGPTGSGKTTTLYAMLQQLNQNSRNILTIEDPIEYDLPGVGQTQVNHKTQMTFAKGLRAVLRQDPDVVMIGEIRDAETAEIAVQAALTGHLVLSTLHTNTAIGAIARLRDLGIKPFLLASSLTGIIAQRLVRRCVEVDQYKGRLGLYEIIAVDKALSQLIHDQADAAKIEQLIRPQTPSLREDGLQHVKLGHTTQAEVMRVTR